MREIPAGVYNMLNHSSGQPMSVKMLLNKTDISDAQLVATCALCFNLYEVQNSSAFWDRVYYAAWYRNLAHLHYFSHLAVLSMSPQTLQTILRRQITCLLRIQRYRGSSFCISKIFPKVLCFLSHSSLQRFCRVLGEVHVDQFYWKKENQARGAPHYHILRWIRTHLSLAKMTQITSWNGPKPGSLVTYPIQKHVPN